VSSRAADKVERSSLQRPAESYRLVRRSGDRDGPTRARGRLVRRVLLTADMVGLVAAFAVAEIAMGALSDERNRPEIVVLFAYFVVSLPAWAIAAKLYGLYDRDEERTDHSTTDDVVGVFHLATVGVWILFAGAWLSGATTPQLRKTVLFWALTILFITVGRSIGRSYARRQPAYVQNTLIVGAGEVGQLIARKYLQHPEYGIRLLGLVDDDAPELREGLEGIELWTPDRLLDVVRDRRVERVVIAFGSLSDEDTLALIRSLRDLDVQIDIVPRLFEAVPAKIDIHSVEGVALLGLRPARLSRSSRAIKRGLDLLGATIGLVLTSPFFAYAALRIKLDSRGPVFFRQERLGEEMHEFTALKFRTMRVGSDTEKHREYVKSIMSTKAAPVAGGLYKLDRGDEVTRFGHWLRKTSLDELPQLINVLKGDMSLVGPRPCIAYETEYFAPHHFERFLVPAGLTGLWQVTARARTTFAEALDMDVAYARSWSLGLDLWILARTPIQVFRQRGAA
jgi:exopolysaccharide biosynthesis polyprenyl glycosylphosphotransferase